MRLFITGASGYIGSVVVERAVKAGHEVYGLARTDAGEAKVRALGATPVRGDLTTLDVLRQQSSQADAVLHLAYIHDWSMDYEKILAIDGVAVDALAEPLVGTNKPFVMTSGTALVDPDPAGGETTEETPFTQPNHPLAGRTRSERHALSWAHRGVKVSSIRLSPYVYGRGGSFFAPMLMEMAAKNKESIYVDAGSTTTNAVHVDDAADLYLLAMESAKAGEIYNGSASNTITLRALAKAIGAALNLPVRSVTREEAEKQWGPFLASFVQFENRPSNRKAREQLGWQPKEIDMLSDIRSGSYRPVADKLLRGETIFSH